jgi:phage-related protein
MAAPAILKIDIIADATKAAAALRDTSDASGKTGSKLMALGQAAATGMAVGAVVQFGKAAVQAATESQVATKRLETVFQSMGDTTGKAAKQAQDYAGALSKKIGVDDDAIMAAQAQLATFGAVSSESARMAGIFDRTTAAAADLAAAGFGTMDGNAVQLGKALQDPVKGLAALGKSGVTFTQAQRDAIAAMVASGDTLGAQKEVLKAVEGQVKGTAAATATSGEKMAVAYGEVQESVGNALLPVLEKLAPLLVKLADFIQRNISWILPLAAAFGVLAVAWNIASVAATLFGVSMWAALWPVLLVIAAIAALVAVGILIAKNWDTIKEAAAAVWSKMQEVWDAILGVVQGVWNWISANWPLLLAILTGPFGLAVLAITRNWDAIMDAARAVWDWLRTNWPLLLAVLTGPIGAAVLLITRNWDTIKDAATSLYTWVHDKLQALVDFFSGIASKVGGFASSIASAIKAPLNGLIRGWNALEFSVPAVEVFGKKIGGQTIGLPHVPELATGGAVMRTGLAIVHRGETFSGVGRSAGGSTNVTVNVTTTGLGPDVPEMQRAVVNAVRGYVNRNGPIRGVAAG